MQVSDLKNKLSKSLDHLKAELVQIRTGRANPTLLENIAVDCYGSKMTIKELGSITLLDPQNLVVSPWDKGLIKDIAKAISVSDLKLNPVAEASFLRVPIPALTEERRKEFGKLVSIKVEEAKNALRNVRQEAMKDIDKDFTDKVIGEDEKFSKKEEVEKIIKDFSQNADKLAEDKKSELLKV